MLNLKAMPFGEALAGTAELLVNGEWLFLNVDTRTAWPTKPQAFTFEGHQVWIMPVTTDNYPGLAANKPANMDRDECFALLHRALSVIAWLEDTGAVVVHMSGGNLALTPGGVSISRVDYALDFLAPAFVLVPDQLVMHSNANRSDHLEQPEVSINGRSGRITSVTIGKMPGRQVIVYDKRAEVIAKYKVGWWEIWNAARERIGSSPLNPTNPAESRIWRVELRAGKLHLKDSWSIRTWSDLDNRLGDFIASTLDAMRYTQPTFDTNRSRWPDSNLWEQVRFHTKADLFEMCSCADPDKVKFVQKEQHDQLLAGQMLGLLISRAVLHEIEAGQLHTFASAAGIEMARAITASPKRFEQKLAKAADRYIVG